MGKLKRLSVLLLFISAAAMCYANQISFQIVQHDESLDCVSEDSLVIEDTLLNGFFEFGFIVTNSDAAISDSKAQDDRLFKIGQGDAFNGYSDYFVQIKLFYERNENSLTNSSDLREIDFIVSSAKSGVTIAEKSIKDIKIDPGKKNNLYKISSDLVNHINKVLKENKA